MTTRPASDLLPTPAVEVAAERLEEMQMRQQAANTRALIEQAPRVSLQIPMDDYDRAMVAKARERGDMASWPVWRCQINGLWFSVQKGIRVQVPEPIAEMYDRTQLGAQHMLNLTPAGEGRPGYWVDADFPG